jgi:hypothetical protein
MVNYLSFVVTSTLSALKSPTRSFVYFDSLNYLASALIVIEWDLELLFYLTIFFISESDCRQIGKEAQYSFF